MKRWLCILLLGVSLLTSVTAYADKEEEEDKTEESGGDTSDWGSYIKKDNNGEAMDSPAGDSGIPSSFDDCSYYDCYIPYKLVPRDIGGWCTGVTNTSFDYGPM